MSIMTTLAQAQAMLPGSKLINTSVEAAQELVVARVGTDE